MSRKIGIFAPGAAGDLLMSTGLLPHREKLWPGAKIVWFVIVNYRDLLAHNPYVDEIRDWSGFNNVELCKPDCSLNKEASCRYAYTADLDEGHFTVPWLASAANWGIPYRDVPKKILGIPSDWEWRPQLFWTSEEEAVAEMFIRTLPLPGKPAIMLETNCYSGQALWNDTTTRTVMAACERHFGDCNYLFATKEGAGTFAGQRGVVECGRFTIRQLVPVYNRCKAFFGCSSGISVAAACQNASPNVASMLYTGCPTFTTNGMARGPHFEVYNSTVHTLEATIKETLCAAK